MNIETRKLSFIQEFLRIKNEEIDQALNDSENDRVIKAAELKEKWS